MLREMALGGQERAILTELARIYPRGVSHNRMVAVLYGNDPDGGSDNASQIVSIVMSRLRAKVAELGWSIPVAYKNGVHRLVRL